MCDIGEKMSKKKHKKANKIQNKKEDKKPSGQQGETKTEQIETPAQEPENKQQSQQNREQKVKRPWLLAVVIMVVIILAMIIIALLGYGYKVDYYKDRYLQNTYINGMDCSELTPEEVANILDAQAREYSLIIYGRNEQGEKIELENVTGDEINMTLTDALGASEDILLQQDEWMWIKSLQGEQYSYSIQQGVVFDEELLREKLSEAEAFKEENMIAPTDAYIGEFSETEGAYELVAHSEGTTLDAEAAIAYVVAAIYGNEKSVDLEELECYLRERNIIM